MVVQKPAPQTMTPKQRLIAALTGQKPDVLPAVPAYLGLFLTDFVRNFYVEKYRQRLHELGVDRYPIDHDEDTRFRAQAIYNAHGIFRTRPDWIEVYDGVSRAFSARIEIVQREGELYYQDTAAGQRAAMLRAPLPRGNAELTETNLSETDIWDESTEIHDSADVDRLIPIRSSAELLASGEMDLLRRLVADHGHRTYISTILDTPYSKVSDHLGFYGLMVTQHDRPALLHHMLRRQLLQTKEWMAALAAVGVDGVYVQEVFTGADLISPRAYDEFVLAYNKPYFKHMRALGLLPIHYVCGDVVPRLEQMARCDVAAIAVEESKKNFTIEIEDVVDRVGDRVAVLGNIDAVRFGLGATFEDMAAEVRRQARIGARARGFVLSTGSPFPLDTNPRLLDTLVETAHSLRPKDWSSS